MIAQGSEQLRRTIEADRGSLPSQSDGIALDKEWLEKASADDVIMPEEYRTHGIVHFSGWPSGKDGRGRASGVAGQPAEQRYWDADKNRNMVINLRTTFEAAHELAKQQTTQTRLFLDAFNDAKEKVKAKMKAEGKTDASKLIARTVLYLIQLLATVLW